MTQRLSDYLTQETSEYLDQLDRLLFSPGTPDIERLLSLARGVRGSSQMAGIDTIATVAERLEDAVRSVLSDNIRWSEEVRQLAVHTVGDLKILVRALNRWGPAEEARVRAAILRWDELDASESGEVVPVSSLFFDDAGPHVLTPAEASEDDGVVPIETLQLQGEAALQEALRLRPEIEARLRAGDAVLLRPLIQELFDLIGLGLIPDRTP